MQRRGWGMGVIRIQRDSLPDVAIEALLRGRVNEAIRAVRDAEAIGFREAKRVVEEYILADPVLRSIWETRRAAALGTLRRIVRVLAVFSGALVGWLVVA